MDINVGMIAAGLAVGLLVGLTGMGAGSLMTPILISVFGIPASTAVGTDLVYAAVTKTFGAGIHHWQKNVNLEIAKWMAFGSVPAAFLGVFSLWNLFDGGVDDWLPKLIGFSLIFVGIGVSVRTFVSVRGLWDHRSLPTDGPLDTHHKVIAVGIGAVFGFLLGLTSVGSGVFFGMALVTLFPLSTRRVVGTDLFHAMMVTVAAAAATILWGTPDFGAVGSILIGSIPGILIGSMFTKRVNHRLLRGAIAIVLAMSGLRLLDPPSWTYAAAGARDRRLRRVVLDERARAQRIAAAGPGDRLPSRRARRSATRPIPERGPGSATGSRPPLAFARRTLRACPGRAPPRSCWRCSSQHRACRSCAPSSSSCSTPRSSTPTSSSRSRRRAREPRCHRQAVLEFTLGNAQPVGMKIVDADGNTVRSLTDGEVQTPKGQGDRALGRPRRPGQHRARRALPAGRHPGRRRPHDHDPVADPGRHPGAVRSDHPGRSHATARGHPLPAVRGAGADAAADRRSAAR